MTTKNIIIYKPKIMKMTVERNKNILFYKWENQSLELDYLTRQKELRKLLVKFNINVNYYLKKVSLSKGKYYTTVKNGDANPVTNLKIHLIYLLVKGDYVYIFNQYVLLRYIINANICSISKYSTISSLSIQTISKIRDKNFNSYRYNTFKKIELANKEIQNSLLDYLENNNKALFLKLTNLNVVDFYKKYSQLKRT